MEKNVYRPSSIHINMFIILFIKSQIRKLENIIFNILGLYTRVWDVADYVIPPAENGAFFVATNVIITANQTRGVYYQNYLKFYSYVKF